MKNKKPQKQKFDFMKIKCHINTNELTKGHYLYKKIELN